MFVSSGSFAMYGAIVDEPVLNDMTFAARLCNSPQCDGKMNLLSGTIGMFVIQQCMKAWKDDGLEITYEALTEYALTNNKEDSFDFRDINLAAPDMPVEIARVLRHKGYSAPQTPMDYYVVFANSLACRVAEDLLGLEKAVGHRFEKVYIVGGGSKASAVSQRIMRLMDRPVMTGLTEAAAAGNALMQLVALGVIESCEKAKEVALRSFSMDVAAI